MQLKIYEYDMKLKYPFSISRHTYYSQPNVILELQHGDFVGYGEATINPYYHITIENLKDAFAQISQRLSSYSFTTPDQLYEDFSDFLAINSFALAALNNASWDLFGNINNTSVSNLIKLPGHAAPQTSYTLGIDTNEAMVKKISDFSWPIYKIKMGTKDDYGLVCDLRKYTNSIFRVDANCAWTSSETIQLSQKLKAIGVEFIEQPLAANDEGQSECFQHSKLPLIADESCCVESDVERCVDKFHGINIKLLKCGGISPAIRMINKAKQLGLKTMVGCMTETTIGISAATQLLPFVDYADLDGPLLIVDDLAEGLNFKNGIIECSNKNGLGITFKGKD